MILFTKYTGIYIFTNINIEKLGGNDPDKRKNNEKQRINKSNNLNTKYGEKEHIIMK